MAHLTLMGKQERGKEAADFLERGPYWLQAHAWRGAWPQVWELAGPESLNPAATTWARERNRR